MKQKLVYCAMLLLVIPGCGSRIINWGKSCFYQGENRTEPRLPYHYMRSVKVYDQFTIIGSFDVLWLSDAVKTDYAKALMRKQGKEGELRQAFLRRQLEENKHFILFIVLVPYDKKFGDTQSIWSVFLEVDGVRAPPLEVKQTDIDVVYQGFFDNQYSCFKTPYRVKFDALDADDNPLITDATQEVKLIFRSVAKEVDVCWDAQEHFPDDEGIVEHNGPWDENLEEVVL